MKARRTGARLRAALALLHALALYWLVVYPRTQKELRHWERRARAIEDPVLRAHALAKLRDERMVLEGAAAFAVLAAPQHRGDVIRACVAFEAIYEFTDALGEQPVDDALAHNRTLNRALVAAVSPMTPHEAHVRRLTNHEPCYLHEMIDACRTALVRLPEHDMVLPRVQRLAVLAAEAQTLNHSGVSGGYQDLARWAASQSTEDATWWELAAAANSPLSVFALFAAASIRGTTDAEAAAVDAAYFPWIGALVWLLESLVDQQEDALSGNLNYVSYYGSSEVAAARLAVVAARAGAAACALSRGATHAALLAGAAGLYLSVPEARHADIAGAGAEIREALGWPVAALSMVLRVRRAVSRRHSPDHRRYPATSGRQDVGPA